MIHFGACTVYCVHLSNWHFYLHFPQDDYENFIEWKRGLTKWRRIMEMWKKCKCRIRKCRRSLKIVYQSEIWHCTPKRRPVIQATNIPFQTDQYYHLRKGKTFQTICTSCKPSYAHHCALNKASNVGVFTALQAYKPVINSQVINVNLSDKLAVLETISDIASTRRNTNVCKVAGQFINQSRQCNLRSAVGSTVALCGWGPPTAVQPRQSL